MNETGTAARAWMNRPSQNSGQRLRFADRRSDSFPDWKRLPHNICTEPKKRFGENA